MGTKLPEKEEFNIIYWGNDLQYWNHILHKIKDGYSNISMQKYQMFEADPKKIQKNIILILAKNPSIIFMDFSINPQETLHLARIIKRMSLTRQIVLVGLSDHNQEESYLTMAVLSGVDLIHIKSGEHHDVFYSAMYHFNAQMAVDHQFARARIKGDQWNIFLPSKITKFSKQGLNLELNVNYPIGNNFILHHPWTSPPNMDSQNVMACHQTTENRYYHFKYSTDVAFEWVIPPIKDEFTSDEEFALKEEAHQEKLIEAQARFEEFFNKNHPKNHKPKYVKILVIDRKLSLYQSEKLSDSFPYIFRLQPYLINPLETLTATFPHLIVVNLEYPSQNLESKAEEGNAIEPIADKEFYFGNKPVDSKELKLYISQFEKIKNFKPYIIIFNARNSKEEFVKYFDYKYIVATPKDYNMEQLLPFAKGLETFFKFDEQNTNETMILDKNNVLSSCEIEEKINVIDISESDIYFKSNKPMSPFTTFKVYSPSKFYVTVIPNHKKAEYKDAYLGVIHGIDELAKAKLRQHINSIFFRQLEDQKAKDLEDFKKIQAEAQKKKVQNG